MLTWSAEQSAALTDIHAWYQAWRYNRARQVYYLHGYAGTGKTTIAVNVGHEIARRAHYCALAGKAAVRLLSQGAPAAYTSTIHRLIYKSIHDEEQDRWIRVKKPRDELDHLDLIIVDEASMVQTRIAKDLISFGIPILAVGDAFQLPPPKDEDGDPFFMRGYDALLHTVHRQADCSPILLAATALRNGEPWTRYADGKALRLVSTMPIEEAAEADTIIAGRNTTRHALNRSYRKDCIGVNHNTPDVGDIVLCLKNDYGANVFNGELWQVDSVREKIDVDSDDQKVIPVAHLDITNTQYAAPPTSVRVPLSFFHSGEKPKRGEVPGAWQHFNFGYCLTCHKAQGSEWPSVVVVDESPVFREMGARWLYTAMTRARKTLTVVDRSIR